MNSNLHRDPYTGLWLQRGGSQTGILDEIDTFVEGEKPRKEHLGGKRSLRHSYP